MSFEGWLIVVLATWVRLFGATLIVPAFYYFRVPKTFFALMLLGLALPAATQQALALNLPATMDAVLMILVAELLTGLILGFGLSVAFAAVEACGNFLDTQSGLGIASLLGYTNQRPQPITAAFFSVTAICLFFAADLHLEFISLVLHWYAAVPPAWLSERLADPKMFATLLHRSFSFGILMALPLAAMLFFADVLLAFAARSMPQLNVIFLSFPLKLLVTLVGLVAVSHLLAPTLVRVLREGALAFS